MLKQVDMAKAIGYIGKNGLSNKSRVIHQRKHLTISKVGNLMFVTRLVYGKLEKKCYLKYKK